jgi:hypothetical protein
VAVDLDTENDVLYISRGAPVASYAEERGDGILLRWAYADDRPSGVTAIGYRGHWRGRVKEFCTLVADHLDVPPSTIKFELKNKT